MVFDHVLRSQIFYADDIILPHQFRGQLVDHIVALVGYMLMEPGNLKPCLFTALAPLCFSGELTLEPGQLLL